MRRGDYGYKNLAREDMEVIARDEEIHKRMYEQIAGNPKVQPITLGQDISDLLDNSREQNKLLLEQNKLLQEENERQKQQLIEEKQKKLKAEKRLKKERVVFWVTFIIPTIISILALIKG